MFPREVLVRGLRVRVTASKASTVWRKQPQSLSASPCRSDPERLRRPPVDPLKWYRPAPAFILVGWLNVQSRPL